MNNPSPDLLRAYPNWDTLWMRKMRRGQDATTISPSEDQSVIGEYIPLTATIIWRNNSQECLAALEMVDGKAEYPFSCVGGWEQGFCLYLNSIAYKGVTACLERTG